MRVLAFLLLVSSLSAQTTNGTTGGTTSGVAGVTVSGAVTPGNCTKFLSGRQIQDAGGTCGGAAVLSNPLNGTLIVDGIDHTAAGGANATTLCLALHYVSLNPGIVQTVIDNVVETGATAFSKDPFNDSTCGNKANGYTLKMELAANYMTNWPSLQIPSSVKVILGRRASENQLGSGNTKSGTIVAACMPNVAPWSGSFAMGCSANYPGAKISTIARASNTLTIVTTAAHNYTTAMATSGTVLLFLWNVTGDLTMNGLCTLNGVTNTTTVTCNDSGNAGSAATGSDGSGVVDSTSSVGSPVVVLGNSGISNNDFDARLEGGTFSCAGAIGCVGFANYDDQERGIIEQVTFTGWQAACGAVMTSNSQNWDFQHVECLTGFRTGLASASGPGTPVSAVGIYWSVNGPSRGFQNLTVNPRGTATVGPIRCDIVLAGTQGGAYIGEHMENAQYQYCTMGSFSGVASRDNVLITANTGSNLQAQTPTTIARNGSNVVTATFGNPTGCVTGEKIIITNVTGGATSFNGTFTNITCGSGGYLATSITWSQTGALESGTITGSAGTICGASPNQANSCATLGGKSTHKFCASSSTDAICSLGTNTNSSLRTTAIGAVRISPSIVLNAVEDDAATNGNTVIASGNWNGTYMQSAPDFGSVQTQINGGTGASALAGTDSGTSTAYVVAGTEIVTLTAGLKGCFLPANANGASPTVAFNGLTAKSIVKYGNQSLATSDMLTTQAACLVYNGTAFQLVNPQGVTGTGKPALADSPVFTTKISTAALNNSVGGGQLILNSTAPSVSSGFGTSPSIATNNGTVSFTINVGTGGVATSGVIGFPTATAGWVVHCDDITTNSSTVFVTKQTASSTTTATIGNFNTSAAAAAWVASDILHCMAFAR